MTRRAEKPKGAQVPESALAQAGPLTHLVEQADCLDWLRRQPADSADLVFTSPPYEKARTYLEDGQDLGIARGTEEWVAWLVEVTRECVRICKGLTALVVEGQTKDFRYSAGPFLLAADLHRAGFALRKPPIYQRVGIAGSGGPDWLRNDYEPIVCVTRPGRLAWSDNTAMGHPPKYAPGGAMSHRLSDGARVNQWGNSFDSGGTTSSPDGTVKTNTRKPSHKPVGGRRVVRGTADGDTVTADAYVPPAIANPGNIVKCKVGGGLMGSRLCHENEAPFPEALAEFFVRSFCPPGGVVCDPFSGSGTTAAVALTWGRNFVGCDLRRSQVDLTLRRLAEVSPMLPGLI